MGLEAPPPPPPQSHPYYLMIVTLLQIWFLSNDNESSLRTIPRILSGILNAKNVLTSEDKQPLFIIMLAKWLVAIEVLLQMEIQMGPPNGNSI